MRILRALYKSLDRYPQYQQNSPVTLGMLQDIIMDAINIMDREERGRERGHNDLVNQNPFDNV